MKKILLSILSSSLALTFIFPAQAIYDGVSALGSKYVLTIATTKEIRSPFCTASMLTERIVVTAAHCMAKDQGEYPDLRFKTSDLYVTQPGVSVTNDDISTRVKVLKVVFKPGYKNLWKPEADEQSTQRDDIAFLFLQDPLVANYTIKVATVAEVEQFVISEKEVIHYGYGLQKVNVQDGSPYTLKLKAIPGYPTKTDLNPKNRFNSSTVMFSREDGRALCPGDSGGPWYGEFTGEVKILAVTVGASGCRSEPPYKGNTLGTLIHPYLDFMEQEWRKFLLEEEALKAEQFEAINRFEISKKNGTLIISDGCHASGINAELQMKVGDDWIVIATSYGMVASDSSCPNTNPSTPWTAVDVKDKNLLRWRYWSPGNWDVLGTPFIYSKPILATPSPSQTISAKPTPTPTRISTSPSPKKLGSILKTITCYKGKISKKVTSKSPVCPKGYKLRK